VRRVLLLALIGCSTGPSGPPEPAQFVAIPSDFQPYASWTSFDVAGPAENENFEAGGPRTVYINQMPAHGSDHFRVGTILVKVIPNGSSSPKDWQVFAMVKRGGGFDADGAPGWEFFGLSIDDGGAVSIDWRGVGPPADAGYSAGLLNVTCVLCHDSARDNDWVQTPQLQLENL
jgi:hypothetical protein